jgi:hypothetical protein
METNLRFRSFDGTQLEGTYSPGQDASDMLAVLVHGITSSRDEFGLFSGLAGHLSGLGVPSMRFEYRCHGESDEPMESMTLSGIVHDIEAAARAGAAESEASRVCVVGMSFGGGVSAYWASVTRVPVSGVVLFAPVIDYEEDVLGQHGALSNGVLKDDVAKRLQRDGFLEMDEIRYGSALINEVSFISGVHGLRNLKCPSLIVHGDADSIVPFSLSERFAREFDRCELVNIPGTDHGFGVGDDEDLSSPETKARHREVCGIVGEFIRKVQSR